MKNLYKLLFIIAALGLSILYSCSEETAPSLYDPGKYQFRPDPVITNIDPPGSALAGVTVLTITGENFSDVPGETNVYFNGVKGQVLNVTTNQIQVKPPVVVADTVLVKVKVAGAINLSNTLLYKLTAAVVEVYKFDPNNVGVPNSITFDSYGNLLVSLFNKGIKKFNPALADSLLPYIPDGPEDKWFTLKYTSNGDIFATRNLSGVWQIRENQMPTPNPWVITRSQSRIADIDFDGNNYLWCVGNNNFILRVSPNKDTTYIPFQANLRAVRVFGNNLFVGGLKQNVEGVWKFEITPNGLANEEMYFNLASNYTGARINAITFANDGDLYIGVTSNQSAPIIVVHTNRQHEILYPGVIPAKSIVNFYWPTGNYLYCVREVELDGSNVKNTQTVLKINMLKNGAINYNNN